MVSLQAPAFADGTQPEDGCRTLNGAQRHARPAGQLLVDAVVGGVDLELDLAVFETELLTAADATRAGGTWRGSMSPALVEVENRPIRFVAGNWQWSADVERADGWASSSLDSGNGRVRLMFNAKGTPIGESVGPRAAAFWRFADEHLGTNCGPMSPAAVGFKD